MARVELKGPDSHAKLPSTIDETVEGGWSFKKVIDALNAMTTEIYASVGEAAGALEAFSISDTMVAVDRPLVLPSYTVATLPDPVAGSVIYVSDGAEGAAILAFSDGTGWLRSDTGAAVAAA